MSCQFLSLCILLPYISVPVHTVGVHQNKLLILLVDGFRWDYIQRTEFNLDGINTLIQEGTKAEWLIPVFPTNSLPNYKSMEIGLYVENHGIVGNFVYDKENQDKLEYMLDREPKWWTEAESFFVTAEKQGIRTRIYNHGGCNLTFDGVKVTHCLLYDGHRTQKEMMSVINDAIYKLQENILDIAYILYATVDNVAHTHGINSDQLKEEIKNLDDAIEDALDIIKTNGQSNINLIVLSDHGMTEVKTENVINLDEAITMADIEDIIEGYSVVQVWPKAGKYEKVLESLSHLSKHLTVYNQRNILDRWFFKKHKFIPPIYATAERGWYIMHPKSANHPGTQYVLKANHGFDNREQDMMGIFLAYGPDFHRGYKVNPFSIVDVYQIVFHVTGIEPRSHNGTWSKVKDMLTYQRIHDDL